jgi:hypothetical protein
VKDILNNNQSPQEWERIVDRMVKLAASQITPGEARQIIYFLSTEYGPRKGPGKAYRFHRSMMINRIIIRMTIGRSVWL